MLLVNVQWSSGHKHVPPVSRLGSICV